MYEGIFEDRKKIPKSDPKNYVFKIILNSTYGLTGDENSFLYDPKMTMDITINGQLSLSMLYEMLNKLHHVEKGNETLTSVESNLGHKLADQYLYPNVKKNNS